MIEKNKTIPHSKHKFNINISQCQKLPNHNIFEKQNELYNVVNYYSSYEKIINVFNTMQFSKLMHFFKNINHFNPKINAHLSSSLAVIFLFLICTTNACDIWKVHDCQGAPTKAEEELMKSDEYTTEQLYKFCDKGKAYVDCMNAKLKCCDLKMELKAALRGYDKQLEKQAWILGPFCAGLGSNNVINYKCRTTRRLPSIAITTLTPTKSTRPTMPPCRIEKVNLFL